MVESISHKDLERQTRAQWMLGLSALLAISIFEPDPARASAHRGMCERHILQSSKTFNVPVGILYAVGLTETGNRGSLHPFALNVEGRSVFASSKSDALKEFARAKSKGAKLIDVGCMQINHYWHKEEFANLSEMFEPAKNVAYAAKFLQQLRKREGSWTLAVARYHAGPDNDPAQKKYVCRVLSNIVAAGFGTWSKESRAFCASSVKRAKRKARPRSVGRAL